MKSSGSDVRTGVSLGLAIVLVGVLVAHAASYLPFVADDALISLRYADRLLDGHGLTWTDGPPLEGYSNLLWILSCAILGAAGVDLILAARILGFLCSIAAVMAVVWAHPTRAQSGAMPAVAAGLGLALSGSLAIWTVGGLEQALLAALLAWALVLCFPLLDGDGPPVRAIVAPAILLSLLCWTRPDGALFTAGAALGLFLARGRSVRTIALAAKLSVLPFLAVCAQVAFRMMYYGEPVPNSAHAKLAWTTTRLLDGAAYLGIGLAFHAALAIPALWLAVRIRDGRIRFLAGVLLIWSSYVVAIGGDIFPGRRHLVPVVVILALMLGAAIDARSRARTGVPRAAWALVATAAMVLLACQQLDPENRRARTERWEWDGQVIGYVLRDAFGERQALLAVDPAGTLPYFSKLPAVDMLGINDRHIARSRPADFGHGYLGHELGDGHYVLDREPDLVLFCTPEGGAAPCFRSGQEMVRDPRFAARYRLATFEGDRPYRFRSSVWVRTEGGRIGIERSPSRIVVPSYLLMATEFSVARPETDGALAITVRPDEPAGYAGLDVEPGSWTMTVIPPAQNVAIAARLSGSQEVLGRARGRLTVKVPGPGARKLDVLITAEPGADAIAVREIVLERPDDR